MKIWGDIVDVENKKVFIVGCFGIGKILFCIKFLCDWVINCCLFNVELYFDFVFFLKFRRFNFVKEFSFCELFERLEFLLLECFNDEIFSYIFENFEKLLILFDGLDEFLDILSFCVN